MAEVRVLQFRWSDETQWRDLREIREIRDAESAEEAVAAARQSYEEDTRRYAHSFTPVFRVEERD